MSRLVDQLYKVLPEQYFKLGRSWYYQLNHILYPPLKEHDFKKMLTEKVGVEKGMVLYIHSSVDKLNLGFSPFVLLKLLMDVVGEKGTLVFPCWHYSGRAEDYLLKPDPIFDVKLSPTTLGLLPELARRTKNAVRSLHPTASAVAIGPMAYELMNEHHLDVYPNGEKSPLYKLMQYNSRIIGLGEKVVSLSFVHVVEDILKERFPLQVLSEKTFPIKVINEGREVLQVETRIPHKNIQRRDIPAFVQKNISHEACTTFTFRGTNFFTAEPKMLFSEMKELALLGKTIYY